MPLQNQLKALAEKIAKLKGKIDTEESTKHAFVLPFINLLGYDTFDPTEVVPEFTADLGLKKGEKVDYAIFQDDQPIIIIECKNWKEKLNSHNSQLFRYFHTTKTRFALLTNGIEYRFYTDLEAANKMDEKPFLEFNITELKENTVHEIAKFHKSNFDVNKIVDNASSLKYTKEIKKLIADELQSPSHHFVKLFASEVYTGRLTEKVMGEFTELVGKAFVQTISEKVNDRLNAALSKEAVQQQEEEQEPEEISKIVTTEEELEGFRIVVAILRRKIPVDRIAHRDTQSYFGILLDDNNRKPLCRLHFNGTTKYLGLINEDKSETKQALGALEDLYQFEEALWQTVDFYENE
ncbi:type I restriction enzyme HsdR N-terminal domain-containing protein [Zobellia galactanivorans]|uniref:type I restriction endonuclease n=1 Tax=Zobellia galactanivorans (strain DSM 12802 / CCUG 47099 / CIP 106680 / NCIMB 13871 / Dsij) TaxID=63186 RepID=UPI0026E30779|nr:type I restriction endonuclease [Zobellia galactanivorans]MDO6807397.1 type I restriction enzyme HsdR N-terminal domain-containing protein [Zobellia galactanivorans]